MKGLCKARRVERYECLDTVFSLYVYVVTCLNAMLYPEQDVQLADASSHEDWQWDRDTLVKASGLMSSLTNFRNIMALVVLRNGLHPVKGLSSKLQKSDSDIYQLTSRLMQWLLR